MFVICQNSRRTHKFEQLMLQKIKFSVSNISIGLIWLFHVSGIIGIVYINSQWFVPATPLNLSACFILILFNVPLNKNLLIVFLSCFLLGMIAEILGVNYQLIFGSYKYGSILGPKFMGVPIIIGINWFICTMITGAIARQFSKHMWQQILIGLTLMLFLDLLIEPIAPLLDFWEFEGGEAPLQNFIGWALIALPLQIVFQKCNIVFKSSFPFNLYLLQVLFFAILLLKSNTLGL